MNDVLETQLIIVLKLVNPYIAEYDNMYYIRHKLNGPAIIYYDGAKQYYCNNRLHNPNGPAVIWPSGHKLWFINGKGKCAKTIKYE